MGKIIQLFPDRENLCWLVNDMIEELEKNISFVASDKIYKVNYLFIVSNENAKVSYGEYEFESDFDFLNFLMNAKICCSKVGSWGITETINVSLMAFVRCYIAYLKGSNNRSISNRNKDSTCEVVINSKLSDIVNTLFEFLVYYYKNRKSVSDEEISAKLTLLINSYIDYWNLNDVIR